MSKITDTSFPDEKYLLALIERLKGWHSFAKEPMDQLLTYSSAAMNSIGECLSDEEFTWEQKKISIDDLWLTSTNPDWNKIILEQCAHSPEKLRALFNLEPEIVPVFERAKYDEMPILVVLHDGKQKVFDGMHRVIASIREGRKEMQTFIGIPGDISRPKCESHVIYDLLKPYARKRNTNREQLIGALRFLRHSYANVDGLLRNRFNEEWLPNKELQEIIAEALLD